jgi:dTDP-4-dehydrorhamnose 3,5-epimerase
MRILPTDLPGVHLIDLHSATDARGTFTRTFCRKTFIAGGLPDRFTQCNFVTNPTQGTLRGLHYQTPPHAEAKLVHCVRGAIYDVVLDLRPGSATQGQWRAFMLEAARPQALHVPEGCAHGYQTLAADAWVYYMMTADHAPAAERGVRWDDPAFEVRWPQVPTLLSDKDRTWPDYAGE